MICLVDLLNNMTTLIEHSNLFPPIRWFVQVIFIIEISIPRSHRGTIMFWCVWIDRCWKFERIILLFLDLSGLWLQSDVIMSKIQAWMPEGPGSFVGVVIISWVGVFFGVRWSFFFAGEGVNLIRGEATLAGDSYELLSKFLTTLFFITGECSFVGVLFGVSFYGIWKSTAKLSIDRFSGF